MKYDVLCSLDSVSMIFRSGGLFSYMSKNLFLFTIVQKLQKSPNIFQSYDSKRAVLPPFYGSQCMYV